jgi:hypothetical protein
LIAVNVLARNVNVLRNRQQKHKKHAFQEPNGDQLILFVEQLLSLDKTWYKYKHFFVCQLTFNNSAWYLTELQEDRKTICKADSMPYSTFMTFTTIRSHHFFLQMSFQEREQQKKALTAGANHITLFQTCHRGCSFIIINSHISEHNISPH